MELIKYSRSNPGTSLKSLEMVFGCGKTQISKILKNKESILAEYQSNASGDRIYSNSKARKSKYSDVNDALYEWFKLATSKNIPVGGPQLIQKGKMIAEALGKSDFKGSVGWLKKWKKRFSIKYFKICGESGDVQGVTIDSWKECLPELVRGYSKNDIWNMDETGLFFVLYLIMALPKKVVVAREERNPSRGLQLLFLCLLQDIKKNLFSSGNQKIRGACWL